MGSTQIKYCYDIEIFPNFFSVIFKQLFSRDKETFFVYNDDAENREFDRLFSFIKSNPYLIGYNNNKFDDIIINKILKSKKIEPTKLYSFAQNLILATNQGKSLWRENEFKWYLRPYKNMYKSIDLMRILAFDKLRIGLKQCSVNMKHEKIQDLPKAYNMPVLSAEEVPEILSYNENDVDITKKLFFKIKKDIVLRHDIGEEYSVDLMNSSNTHIGKTILNHYYRERSGVEYDDFKVLRTERPIVHFKECISDTIYFTNPNFINMLNDLSLISVQRTKGAIDYKLIHNNKGYQLGTGGLHSIDEPAIYQETDDYYLIDADVSSFYPNIMLNFNIKPEHLSVDFFDILRFLTEKRLEAKANKDKTTSDALKISINSIYGLLNFPYYWLYDPKAAMSVTINGQLLLLMLIERLEDGGFEIISANTDGVTAKVNKGRESEYYDICNKWESDTDFELEYAYYSKYVRRDVNNYLTKIYKKIEKGVSYDSDEVKKKGAFVTKVELNKAFKNPIVPIALEKFYIESIPISKTLREHDDIMDFCKSQKVGSQFKMEHHLVDLETRSSVIESLQKTNRYFISTKGGTLLKRKDDGSEYNIESGFLTTILNDYNDEYDYMSDIDFEYYEKECRKIINAVSKNGQISLFE